MVPAAAVLPVVAVAAVAALAPNTLLDGTVVKLRIAENLSSAHAKTGQSVAFEVVEDVLVQGVVVLPKGAQALATVIDASSKKSMGRAASWM